jgi:hypothetical protein
VILLCATSVFSGLLTLNHIGHKEHGGCAERGIRPSPEPGSCVWEGYRGLTGDWLMRGRFPTVYPTGPSEEGSAESEPSFLFFLAQLLASEQFSQSKSLFITRVKL